MATTPPETLASPTATREVLARFGRSPAKGLGQHFLIDGNILAKIVEAARLSRADFVLEVGPGIGTLTRELAGAAGRVVAVELDRELLPVLEYTLQGFDNVQVIQADAVRLDPAALGTKARGAPAEQAGGSRSAQARGTPPAPLLPNKLVSNLPYNIAGPLLARYLERFPSIERYVVMVQKEVADRLLAGPGGKDYGSLSVRVAFWCESSRVCRVPRTAFLPKPHVDSSVVLLTRRPRPAVEVPDEVQFFRVVRASLAQRRKTLRNALADGLNMAPRAVEEALIGVGVDPKRRGETLSLEEFARVTRAVGP